VTTSEHIRPQHLARQAVIYVRQSTPHQLLRNQESLDLQYALRDRAAGCGWPAARVRVIDADLGITASSAAARPGFQELVALVSLGQVGLVLAYDATRLARNCADWYQLLDLCGLRGCLVGDQDGVYDPASANGRLILGLKGLIAELELHTIRARLTAGLLNKAGRGELAVTLPTGLVRDPAGRVVKHPDREVQARTELVFATFLRVRSVTKVVRHLNDHGLRLPRRTYHGDITWRVPTIATVASVLKNPAYAGAFVYGRTRTVPAAPPAAARAARRPMAEWRVVVRDKYPAYTDWATFEKIQGMIRDNHAEYDRNKTRGVPRPGKALLHGLVHCGACGHKMLVQYKGGVRYVCNALRLKYQAPVCQYLPGDPIDGAVVPAFFAALSPAELDVYAEAAAAAGREYEEARRGRDQQLERLRYQARLAERQYQKADPDNRLVAAELERRWELALREVRQAEEAEQQLEARHRPPDPTGPDLRAALADVARGVPDLWRRDGLTAPQKKALLRCLIDKVVAHRPTPDAVRVRVVWRGGDTTTFDVPVAVGALARLPGAGEMARVAVELFGRGESDEAIAAELTRRGYRSPREVAVLPSTVRTIRRRHGLRRPRPGSRPRGIPGKLTVPQLVRRLGVPLHWVYQRLGRGEIVLPLDPVRKMYLFPDTPEALAELQALKAGRVHRVQL
jgi:DNA invertase Pin-like site-specific DNA recombinase